MAVNISGIRRNIKNVAHNYTDAQVKVREATSNDPWGPSSTMMSEIADLTYNVVAFTEIMQMIWKRLNDNGKNWRHVYKALVLLEYLIKTGSEKVAQQCKENIYAIQTLKDFQHLDDNKDQGINVREKAKVLVSLLKDDERLKNERVRALKAKERFAQSAAGIGNDTVYNSTRERIPSESLNRSRSPAALSNELTTSEMEAARPQTIGEEELQLQLALAMSREEAEQEETKEKSDDMRLQLALQKSKENKDAPDGKLPIRSESGDGIPVSRVVSSGGRPSNDLLDLDLDFGQPKLVAQPPPPTRTSASSSSVDAWGIPVATENKNNHLDPWAGAGSGAAAASAAAATAAAATAGGANDPWSPVKGEQQHHPHLGAVPRTSPLPNIGGPSPSRQLPTVVANDPWSPVPVGSQELPSVDPSTSSSSVLRNNNNDAWNNALTSAAEAAPVSTLGGVDPFSPVAQRELAEFDLLRNEIDTNGTNKNGGTTSPNPFDLGEMSAMMPTNTGAKPKTSVQGMLGEHSNLVNLDNLVTDTKTQAVRNPFEQHPPNPFQSAKSPKPAMNQLLQQQTTGTWTTQQQQQQSSNQQADFNPFF